MDRNRGIESHLTAPSAGTGGCPPRGWYAVATVLATVLAAWPGAAAVRAAEEVSGPIESIPLADRSVALPAHDEAEIRFTRIDPVAVGIDFVNRLEDRNIRNYLLNGAGLAVGDYDGDGLPDIFLVCQDGPNKLFRQVAPWKFEDATRSARVSDSGAWGCGAAFVDIENDGDLDLIVCNKGAHSELHVNQGDGTFVGALVDFSSGEVAGPTMVAPADYDRDGDLDFYVTVTRLQDFRRDAGYRVEITQAADGKRRVLPPHDIDAEFVGDNILTELGRPDLLLENRGPGPGGLPDVRNRLAAAGMSPRREHGLAAVWWDANNDDWPDLYISNDFQGPDHLYLNRGDGTFADVLPASVAYTSWYSMGSDFADIDNDGWFDYLSTDMSATTHLKSKTMMGAMERSQWFLDNLEPRQYMRNVLHLNTGCGAFIDIAFHAGVDSTDWTWGGFFGDLDNDGWEDLFFTNGIERNVQDSDLAAETDRMSREGASPDAVDARILAAPRLAEQNLAFRNARDLTFDDVTELWGFGGLSVSHGAVLCDLDRDGDLDLVVNGMNEPPLLYRNDTRDGNGVLVSLTGSTSNRFGLGARIEIEAGGARQARIMTCGRGYASGTEPVAHFGLGDAETIDRLTVRWPSGLVQEFRGLNASAHHRIREPEAASEADAATPGPAKALAAAAMDAAWFRHEAPDTRIPGRHVEDAFDDFAVQPLLPNALSRFGPGVAFGDFNADGRDDVFVSGAANSSGRILLAGNDGTFQQIPTPAALEADAAAEDLGALWLDADGDGDLDLFVVSGGNQSAAGDGQFQDRLYLNNGTGDLEAAPAGAVPDSTGRSGGCVAAADFDRDGDLDLFVGGRLVPQAYPAAPESRLLVNEGGRFVEAPDAAAPGIRHGGMISAALWSDLDDDGWIDLVTAAEWGTVSVRLNRQGTLEDATRMAGLAGHTGWWNGLAAGDVDGDGDIDLVATNFGTNTKYHASPGKPVMLYAGDFGDGERHLVEAVYKEGKILPVRGRSCSSNAMPFLRERFPTYRSFALADVGEIYTPERLEGAEKREITTLESCLFLNDGDGSFSVRALPTMAQLAPAFGAALEDLDGDGALDLVLAQNFHHAQRETGRMNAGLGLVLRGDGAGGFQPLTPRESGVAARVDSRSLAVADVTGDHAPDLVVGVNDGPVHVFGNRSAEAWGRLQLHGTEGNLTAVGARIEIVRGDGRRLVRELAAGGSFLTQSPAVLSVPLAWCGETAQLRVRWPDGSRSEHALELSLFGESGLGVLSAPDGGSRR